MIHKKEEMKEIVNAFDLYHAELIPILHEDAMVASVFKVIATGTKDRVLKVCTRQGDYLRELYFLNQLAGRIPVPKVLQSLELGGKGGAVLMEYVPGTLLSRNPMTHLLAADMGRVLAQIHLMSVAGYGDLTQQLTNDPWISLQAKFEEGLDECQTVLSHIVLDRCRAAFFILRDQLSVAEPPCIIHRDFRPGNLIVSDNQIKAVIDWSSARAGFAAEDFLFLEDEQWQPAFTDAFLHGYKSVKTMPLYCSFMPLLRLSKALGVVGFIAKRGVVSLQDSPLYQKHWKYLHALHLNDLND